MTQRFPQSLPEFQRMFPDEEACAAYLEEVRWPEGRNKKSLRQFSASKPGRQRRKGTAAGLAAYQASKAASASARAQKQAQGAAAAWARSRGKASPKTPLK